MLQISANLSNQVFPISWFYMIGKNISKHINQISLWEKFPNNPDWLSFSKSSLAARFLRNEK